MDDDLRSLAADLDEAPLAAEKLIRKAVQFTANEIKKDWSQGADHTGLRSYARSIDYDVGYKGSSVVAEIGPNPEKRQGTFGFVEDAPGDVRSAPQHAGRDALEANEADFERGLATALWDATVGKDARKGPA